MAGGTVNIGTGATLTFGTSSFSCSLLAMRPAGIKRASIPTSHMATAGPGTVTTQFGGMTFVPGDLVDPGTIECDIQFAPGTTPPIHLVPETITLTFRKFAADASATSWAASGFATSYTAKAPLEGLATGTLTLKMSGAWTMTPAA